MEPDLPASSYRNHLVKFVYLGHISELIQKEIYISRKGQILPGRRHLDQRLVNAENKHGCQGMPGVLLIRYL